MDGNTTDYELLLNEMDMLDHRPGQKGPGWVDTRLMLEENLRLIRRCSIVLIALLVIVSCRTYHVVFADYVRQYCKTGSFTNPAYAGTNHTESMNGTWVMQAAAGGG